MTDLEQKIIWAVINAQICSDAGKGISELQEAIQKQSYPGYMGSYKGKDESIHAAIGMILTQKKQKESTYKVDFYVSEGDIGYNSLIVYFTFRIKDMKRLQVSFHTFDRKLRKYLSKSHQTRWDAKNSRKTCIKLHEIMQKGENT